MASYIEPIRFALVVFPFLALAISSVFFIYEYRKYGTFLVTRAARECKIFCVNRKRKFLL
ncbi:hypothetical protein SFA90_04670 [Enterococcus faecium]|nr:hypothetical protein SFA90_04670 [Enterococcus faecium]